MRQHIEQRIAALAAKFPTATRWELGLLDWAGNGSPTQHCTLDEIGRRQGISAQRVEQITQGALRKLRKKLGRDEVRAAIQYFSLTTNQEYRQQAA